MAKEISLDAIQGVLQSESIENLKMTELYELFRKESSIANFRPESIFQIDPRNGELIVYNSSRANRPHSDATKPIESQKNTEDNCPICAGKTTGIMDLTKLSEGHTFINKNMFPIFFPFEEDPSDYMESVSFGLHFLQWTSSLHNIDWHNISQSDGVIVLKRLAALEKKLLLDSKGYMPVSESEVPDKITYGYVSIIKNFGKIAGGSLAHGHQQIVASNIMPKQIFNNWNFYMNNQENFTKFLLSMNPEELIVKEYRDAILLVPYFMRRPYDMFLILKDTSKKFLHELNEEELETISLAWGEATRAILKILKHSNKEEAYNVTINNGPGAGLYFEFLPFTQLIGGYEKIGLWVCQESPAKAADVLRNFIENG